MENGHFRHCKGVGCRCEIKRYWIVAFVTFITLVIEVWGGYDSKSLALLSDGAHVGVDFISIIVAIAVEYHILLSGNENKKAEIRGWGGVLSSILLFVSVGLIFKTAVERLFSQDQINSVKMIVFAAIGLSGNYVSLRLLHESEEEHDTHAALEAHIVSDLVQSIGVVGVGFVVFFTHWYIIDPISSFAIVAWLSWLSVKTFKRSWKSTQGTRK